MVIKVMIDPGHSERTPGKGVGSYREYLSNRSVARLLRKKLEAHGFKVAYTVDLSDPVDKLLHNRAMVAVNWGADVFVSLHSNAHGDPDVTGTETFVHSNSTASIPIAEKVQEALVEALGTKNRGTKSANFGVLRSSYRYMLAFLTEGEFFTNPEQREWMKTDDYNERYSDGVAKGICLYYNKKYNPSVKPAKPDTSKPIKNPDKNDMVVVEVANLYTYNSKDWNDKGPIVNIGEAFTVISVHKVGSGTMYQLQSGLYITANEEFVSIKEGENKTIGKPEKEEVNKLDKEKIVIHSDKDYITAQKLSIRKKISVIEKRAVEGKIAETVYVVGGGTKGLEKAADKLVDLSGDTWEDTVAAVSKFVDKM